MQKDTIKKVSREVENILKEDFEKLNFSNGVTYSANLNRDYSNANVIVGLHSKDFEYFDKVLERLKNLDPSIRIKKNFGKITSLQI